MNEYNRMVLDGAAFGDAEKWFAARKDTIGKELTRLGTLRAAKA